MSKFLTCFWVVLLSTFLWAESPWQGVSKEQFVKSALMNVQQEGDFFFIPFPDSGDTYSSRNSWYYHKLRTNTSQQILALLDAFKRKNPNLKVLSFTIEKDQTARDAGPVIHGIFVHAVKK